MQSDILKLFDMPILEFESGKDTQGYLSAHITSVFEENRQFIPLDMQEATDEALTTWLKNRTIPRNRAYVQNLLDKMGLSIKDSKGILDICRGLSLNDSFWIVPKSYDWQFADYNLYDNEFDEVVANIAFDGQGEYSDTKRRSSPEFTTGGMLAKAWRRIDGKIYLYKSGTTGFANAGHEPYSEYYAAQVANVLGFENTYYDLKEWKGILCSVCELWTNKDTAFIPIGRLVQQGGLPGVLEYCKGLGAEFYEAVVDIVVFDAIIINEDRHFGNFGLLINNDDNTIVRPAPIFDNGLSLLWTMLDSEMDSYESVVPNRLPRTYDDFIGTAHNYMTARHIAAVKNLKDFEFQRHPAHNLDGHRVHVLETLVRKQAAKLLLA
jgi:hypothetical protein